MSESAAFVLFLTLGLQVYLFTSLWWLIYWGRRSRASRITGWRGGPTAFAPLALLLGFCVVGLVRFIIARLQ
ncbi:MAG: hypothetical protein ACR2IE_20115 [Candidatus Sumerlaeaceae bacterium]